MKKILLALTVLSLFSCGSTSNKSTNPALYEVLTQQSDGGANIRFFEILTEPNEIKMLQNDPNLKKKIKPDDINTCNFIILNMGEKSVKGATIDVVDVQETQDAIIVTVKENEPKSDGNPVTDYVYPYSIVKIHSKKNIIFK